MSALEVIDTFAWIEYFSGSEKGEVVRSYIDAGGVITPTIVIAELTDKYTREGYDPKERLKFVKTKSAIIELDDLIAEEAGKISAERRKSVKGWGMVDSIVFASAVAKGARVLTGDEHFKGLKEVILLT